MSQDNEYATHQELKTKFQFESLSVLAQQGQSSFFISLANGVIVFFVINPTMESNFMTYWISALVVVSLLRFFSIRLFFQLDESSKRLGIWFNSYLVLVYLSALCWGVLPLTDEFLASEQSFAFIIFIIAGMSAGALVALYAKLNAILPYLIIILLPLIYVLSIGSAGEQLGMAMLAGLYLVMLVRSAYVLNASAQKTLQLEVQNSELFDFLLKSNRVTKDDISPSQTYEI